jgi:hypothetical protein
MKKILAALMLCMPLLGLTGCSWAHVFSTPSEIQVNDVCVGKSRNAIISVLGLPKSTETKKEGRTDMFEFVDGYSAGSKARVVLYMAGDVFTCGLAEVIFWPIELAVGNGIEGRAIVDYGMDDIAKSVLLTKRDGSPYKRPEQNSDPSASHSAM